MLLLNTLTILNALVLYVAVEWSGSIPGGVKNFNLYLGTGCVSFVFLFCVVSFSGPHIVLTTFSGRPAIVSV